MMPPQQPRIVLHDAPAERERQLRRVQKMADELLATLRPLGPDDTQPIAGQEIEEIREAARRTEHYRHYRTTDDDPGAA